jgi:hypothetical protein
MRYQLCLLQHETAYVLAPRRRANRADQCLLPRENRKIFAHSERYWKCAHSTSGGIPACPQLAESPTPCPRRICWSAGRNLLRSVAPRSEPDRSAY